MENHYVFKLKVVLLSLFLGIQTGFAQSGDVTGTVSDASTGQTLPGVTVLVKGTTTGTTTGIDGDYRITVDPGAVLVFSYVGFVSQEITVQPGTTVNVALEVSMAELEEFIVIGYGVQKKDDATGSVAAVGSDEFIQGTVLAPTQLITGKVAGVQITSGGGAPGEGATVRIRGGSSLSASNDPLYVIDGVPIDNDGVSGMRNPLNTINPNDIETFTVLKDASATAIYGSRASNGVIIITTKKGKAGEGKRPIQLNYNGVFSLYEPTKRIDVLDADQFTGLIQERYPSQTSLLGTQSTDWQDEIYQTSFGQDHYLSATGAIAKTVPFRVSYGYTNQDGILKTDNMTRHTIAGSFNPTFFDDHLKVDLNIKTMFIKNKFADRGAIGSAIQYDPTKPVTNDTLYTVTYTDSDGNQQTLNTDYGGYWAWLQRDNGSFQPVEQGSSNPVALLNMRDDESDVNRIIGNVQLDYKFHFLPELRANLNLGLDNSSSEGGVFVPDYAPWEFDPVNGGGLQTDYTQDKRNEVLDFYLQYVKNVESISSTFDIMGGYSWQHFWRENTNYSTNLNRTIVNDSSIDKTESYLVSFFGRFNYTFKDKYLLTFTLRNDGTSRFSEDTRWGLFPAVALAWKIVDEPWMAGANVLSQLKLRAGWGITGQQNIGQGDYPYLPRYTFSDARARDMFGQANFITTLRPEGYEANIKWEETTTWNIGLDYGFAGDRFYGTLDYYFRETEDLLNEIPVPAGSNLTNFILTNIGSLQNEGFEFAISTKPIVRQELFWEVTLNATYQTNEITKLTAVDDPEYLGVFTGGISGGVGNTVQIHSVGYPFNSYFVYEQVYDAEGNPIEGLYVDRDGDGQITDSDRYHFKDPTPKFYFGLATDLRWKNWSFSFSGRANFGNYIYNNVSSENAVYERLYRPEGPYLGNVTSDVLDINFVTPQYLSNYFIEDGAYFRMDFMTLGYFFDDLANGNVDLGLNLTVNNAFVITNYRGIDPEISNGIDNRIYPRPRVWALGVNVTF
jgi:iron complex outermembrane receptor protein